MVVTVAVSVTDARRVGTPVTVSVGVRVHIGV